MSDQESNYFAEDGIRPVEKSDLEIADTFQDAGTRPVEESPDYLVKGDRQAEVIAEENIIIPPGEKRVISQRPLVEIRNLPNKS